MRHIQTHTTGSDCTAPFDVVEYKAKTAREFVDEILSDSFWNWGKITVESKQVGIQFMRDGVPKSYVPSRVEYKENSCLDEIPAEWSNIKIKAVKASGGWGCMDYHIIADDTQTDEEKNDMKTKDIPDEMFREWDGQRVTNIVRMLNNMGAIFEIEWEGIKYTNKTHKE